MKNEILIFVKRTIYVPCMVLTCIIILFIFAKLIETDVLNISSAQILVSISIIIVIFCGTYLTERKTGNVKTSIIVSGIFFVLLLCSTFLLHHTDFSISSLVKNFISIFCGTILGIFFGRHKYNKLRFSKKKRRFATK